jgi:hypothetical protein
MDKETAGGVFHDRSDIDKFAAFAALYSETLIFHIELRT